MSPIAPLLLALFTPSQDDLPFPGEVHLTGFAGTEARSLDDFLGRTVLIEFFAHWCAPCARQVAHMNELSERYADRGLVVLGVTGDAPADALPWIERFEMRYPYAFDPDLELQVALGFRPLPFAVLLDATGTAVWRGNPASLGDRVVEEVLEGAPEPIAWTELQGGEDVRSAIAEGRYAAARRLASGSRLGEAGGILERFVEAVISSRVEHAERAVAAGDWLSVRERCVELRAGLGDEDLPGSLLEALERVETDAEVRAILEAQDTLRATWAGVTGVSSRAAADALIEELRRITADFEGSYVARQGELYVAGIENLKRVLP